MKRPLLSLACLLPLAIACGQTDNSQDSEVKIIGGQIVTAGGINGMPSFEKSVVGLFSTSFSSCSGTLISRRHVLTAAHCFKDGNARHIELYQNGVNTDIDIPVLATHMKRGVNPAQGDLTDENGKFADIAIVELAEPVSNAFKIAELPVTGYPNTDMAGWKVGVGHHSTSKNDFPNRNPESSPGHIGPTQQMHWKADVTYSHDNSDGGFLTENEDTWPGDSGGPFLTFNSATRRFMVHGTLKGDEFEWELRNKYTSVAYHLPWIKSIVGYQIEDVNRYGIVSIENPTSKKCWSGLPNRQFPFPTPGPTPEGQVVTQHECSPMNLTQNFTVHVEGFLTFTIKDVFGKCLTVPNGSTQDGEPIRFQTCSQASHQKWLMIPNSNGYPEYQIKAAHSGKCAVIQGMNIQPGIEMLQWSCGGAYHEFFRFR